MRLSSRGYFLSRQETGEFDHLVAKHGAAPKDRQSPEHSIRHVALGAGHQEHSPCRPVVQEREVHIGAVHRHNRAGVEPEHPRHLCVVRLAVGDVSPGRQLPVMVQLQVQFDGALGSAEVRPIEHLQAQSDHGGVEAHEGVLEAELASLCGRKLPAAIKQALEHRLIDLPRPMFVRIRKRGALRSLLEAKDGQAFPLQSRVRGKSS